MTAARSTLACGVTRATNPTSTTSAPPMRRRRGMPSAAPAIMTSPMITAQFAPDTAVRWLSEVDFIAASSVTLTALVSPIASPGSRSPPSPGRVCAAETKPERSALAQPRYHGGWPVTRGLPLANTRNATESPAPSSPACRRGRVPCRFRIRVAHPGRRTRAREPGGQPHPPHGDRGEGDRQRCAGAAGIEHLVGDRGGADRPVPLCRLDQRIGHPRRRGKSGRTKHERRRHRHEDRRTGHAVDSLGPNQESHDREEAGDGPQ